MERSQKNFSSQSNQNRKLYLLILFFVLYFNSNAQQIANYVNNGSFEDYHINIIYKLPYYWNGTDSSKYCGELLVPPSKVPFSTYCYQWPKHGKNHFIFNTFSNFTPNNRAYPRNHLKQTLKATMRYCVTFYVNLSNQSTHGIDAIGAYFGDGSVDTIKNCTNPINYLNPQIENPVNNIITDTLNWIPVTGTFVAAGTEKYLIIGDFKSDANTHTALTNTANLPSNWAEYLIDAVSCIEMDVAAYAGPDKNILAGQSTYLGREKDFAIDPYCYWYQLPGMTPLDTSSGITVSPTVTTTYVVRQELECNAIKWDTVVVYVGYTGLEELNGKWLAFSLFPNPVANILAIRWDIKACEDCQDFSAGIYNNLGQLMREEELVFTNGVGKISTYDLPNGVYVLRLKNSKSIIVNSKFVVEH